MPQYRIDGYYPESDIYSVGGMVWLEDEARRRLKTLNSNRSSFVEYWLMAPDAHPEHDALDKDTIIQPVAWQ